RLRCTVDMQAAERRRRTLVGKRFRLAAAEPRPDHAEPLTGRVEVDLDGIRRRQLGVGGDVAALAGGVVVPAVVEAGDLVAAHEAEGEPHAAMRAAVLPDMGGPVPVAPHHDLLIEKAGAGRGGMLKPLGYRDRIPSGVRCHVETSTTRAATELLRGSPRR